MLKISNWTIKAQILFISLVIFLFISLLLSLTIGISNNIIQEILSDSSQKIFERLTISAISSLWIYQTGQNSLVTQTGNSITMVRKLNQLFHTLILEFQTLQIDIPDLCLQDTTLMNEFATNSTICCGVYGIAMNENLEKQLLSIQYSTTILSTFLIALDDSYTSPIYYFSNNAAQYYCITKYIVPSSNFKPQSRSYYLDHLKNSANATDLTALYFSNPYQTLQFQIRIPMTTNLLDSQNNIVGVVAKSLDFNFSSIILQSADSSLYVVNKNGLVVYSQEYFVINSSVFYLNSTSQTGFTNEDYIQIMYQHYNQTYVNNCSDFQSFGVLCRYNSFFQENVLIISKNITNSPLILIIVMQIKQLKNAETIHLNFLQDQLVVLFKNELIITLLVPIVIIIFSQLIIILILRQLSILISKLRLQIFPNFQAQNLLSHKLKKLQINSDEVNNLALALFQHSNITYKSDECCIQEKIQYPKIEHFQRQFITIWIDYFKNTIINMQNADNQREKAFSFNTRIKQTL